MPNELSRILVCRTDALGDTLLTLPVCAALKEAFPRARVAMLVSAYAAEAVAQQPEVDQVLVYDAAGQHAGRAGFRRLRQLVAQNRFDAALLVFPDPRISWAVFRAGVPRRVGTGRRWWSCLFTVRVRHSRARAQKHEAEYNLDLVRALGVPAELRPPRLRVTGEAREWAEHYYQEAGISGQARLVIIHPGGRGSSANWPRERYIALAAMILRETPAKVLLTGAKAEQAQLVAESARHEPRPLVLDQAVSLRQLAALIARADVFISGNTGPLHMAAGLDARIIALFPAAGVTGPVRWGPLSQRAEVLCPPEERPEPGLLAITPQRVLEKVKAALLPSTGSRT